MSWSALISVVVLLTVGATPCAADRGDIESPLEPGPILRVDRSKLLEPEPWWLFLADQPQVDEAVWRVSASDFAFEALVLQSGGPALVLLPHLEGTSRVARYVARRFSAAGYQVFAVLPPARAVQREPSPDLLVQVLQDRIRAGRLAVRLVAQELGTSCIVVLGLSIGALAAVPVAALEPGVSGLIAALGGADLQLIASESTDPLLRVARSTEQGSPGLPPERIDRVDPLTFASRVDPSRVLLLSGRWDRVMPEASRVALRGALGDPEEIVFPTGHYSFAAALPFAVTSSIAHASKICGTVAP